MWREHMDACMHRHHATRVHPPLALTRKHGKNIALEQAQRWNALPAEERARIRNIAGELRASGLVGDRRVMLTTHQNAFVSMRPPWAHTQRVMIHPRPRASGMFAFLFYKTAES